MSGCRQVGRDIRFDSNLCWVWWPSKTCENLDSNKQSFKSPTHNQLTNNQNAKDVPLAECVDGYSGFLKGNNDEHFSRSKVCTYELLMFNFYLIRKLSLDQESVFINKQILASLDELSSSKITLDKYCAWKRLIAFQYESAKDYLLTKHFVFRTWHRRKN